MSDTNEYSSVQSKAGSEKASTSDARSSIPADDFREGEFRLITRWAVTRMLGISLSTMERRQREDVNFPVPFLIGTRNVRWLQHEVENYILNLPRADRFG